MKLHTNEYFAKEPKVLVKRTKFQPPVFFHKTTFNNGDLIPIYSEEILPGDTLKLDLGSVVRMSTPVKPIMDNIFLDVFAFFIPNRLVWKHWEDFMGANKVGPWRSTIEYTLPQTIAPQNSGSAGSSFNVTNYHQGDYFTKPIATRDVVAVTTPTALGDSLIKRGMLLEASSSTATSATLKAITTTTLDSTKFYWILYNGWKVGSLADYFGIPVGTFTRVNSLYFRAYCQVYNEYFRDENYMSYINDDFANDSDVLGSNYQSLLSWTSDVIDTVKGAKPLRVCRFHDMFSSVLPEPEFGDSVKIPFGSTAPVNALGNTQWTVDNGVTHHTLFFNSSDSGIVSPKFDSGTSGSARSLNYYDGLVTDLSGAIGTIRDLRDAFQVLRYQERSARSGSRYIEIIKAQFGVSNPDGRLQRPEYLGGFRKVLNVTQVLQTSSTDTTSPQGNTAAYSLTSANESLFTKSFTEHGIVLVLACTRTSRSYQEGLEKRFSRRRKLDFYFPVFAYRSEVPVLNKEIFQSYNWIAIRSSSSDWSGVSSAYSYPEEVFGYQEAYYEYRYHNSIVSSDFRSQAPETLDFWHYADFYEMEPYASTDWFLEGPQNVDRTLAVTSDTSRQFIADFGFKVDFTRCMPLYSIPGLADHF